MGLAVGPRVGATTLVVGDAAGSINPFNGEGIAYGYETGRLAAASLGEALCAATGSRRSIRYETRLEEAYGLYFRVARAFIRVISRPELMQLCVGHRHALGVPDELDPPDHGQPAPARRDRPGRGRLPGPGRSSPGWPPKGPDRHRRAPLAPAYLSTAWRHPAGDRVVGGGEGAGGHRRPVGGGLEEGLDPAARR